MTESVLADRERIMKRRQEISKEIMEIRELYLNAMKMDIARLREEDEQLLTDFRLLCWPFTKEPLK